MKHVFIGPSCLLASSTQYCIRHVEFHTASTQINTYIPGTYLFSFLKGAASDETVVIAAVSFCLAGNFVATNCLAPHCDFKNPKIWCQ